MAEIEEKGDSIWVRKEKKLNLLENAISDGLKKCEYWDYITRKYNDTDTGTDK